MQALEAGTHMNEPVCGGKPGSNVHLVARLSHFISWSACFPLPHVESGLCPATPCQPSLCSQTYALLIPEWAILSSSTEKQPFGSHEPL